MNETAMPAARANARRAEQLLQVRRARDRHRAGARRTLSLAMWHNGKWRWSCARRISARVVAAPAAARASGAREHRAAAGRVPCRYGVKASRISRPLQLQLVVAPPAT